MKVILLFAFSALFLTVGCESHEHDRWHRGGAYDNAPYHGGYGTGSGEYRGYPNYSPGPFPDHPYHGGY